MKKLLLFTVLICYTIASFGVSVNYFYCCGTLKSVTLSEVKPEKNCKNKLKKGCCSGKKCCKNVTVSVKLKSDQKATDKINLPYNAPASPALVYTDNYTFFVLSKINPTDFYNQPPDNLPKRNILFCIFRI